MSSEISGTLKTVEVDYNDQVKRGQVLAKIGTTKLEAQIKQTTASTDAALARALQTQATISETKAKLARLIQV